MLQEKHLSVWCPRSTWCFLEQNTWCDYINDWIWAAFGGCRRVLWYMIRDQVYLFVYFFVVYQVYFMLWILCGLYYVHTYMYFMCILCVHYIYIYSYVYRIYLCIDCVYIMCMLRVYCIFCVHYVYIIYHVYIMLSFLTLLLPNLQIHLVARKPKGIKHASCFFFLRVYAFRSYLFTLQLSIINWPTAYVFILIYLLMRLVVVVCSSLVFPSSFTSCVFIVLITMVICHLELLTVNPLKRPYCGMLQYTYIGCGAWHFQGSFILTHKLYQSCYFDPSSSMRKKYQNSNESGVSCKWCFSFWKNFKGWTFSLLKHDLLKISEDFSDPWATFTLFWLVLTVYGTQVKHTSECKRIRAPTPEIKFKMSLGEFGDWTD